MITISEHKKAILNCDSIEAVEQYLLDINEKDYSSQGLRQIKSYANQVIKMYTPPKKGSRKKKPFNPFEQQSIVDD